MQASLLTSESGTLMMSMLRNQRSRAQYHYSISFKITYLAIKNV